MAKMTELTVAITELQRNFSYYIGLVEQGDVCVIITKYGKPQAVLLPVEYLNELEELENARTNLQED